MSPTEIAKKIDDIAALIMANPIDGIFGSIKVQRTNRIKMKSNILMAKNYLLFEPDDFKPLFQVEHEMDNELFQNPLCFSIGRKKIWLSTWYHGKGAVENEVESQPFVLSWKAFLAKEEINDVEGLNGYCNAAIFTLEEGFRILESWSKWVACSGNKEV